VVKVIRQKGRIASAHGRFNRILQVAPACRLPPCFLRPTGVHIPNDISTGSAVFLQGSRSWQTKRQTDRPRYAVGNNRPHLRTVRSTAMRPKKRANNDPKYFPFRYTIGTVLAHIIIQQAWVIRPIVKDRAFLRSVLHFLLQLCYWRLNVGLLILATKYVLQACVYAYAKLMLVYAAKFSGSFSKDWIS